jgi:uncharacterized membrane protein YhaH (DUF805 family)
MTARDFLFGLGCVAIGCVALGLILRLGMGPRWFGFYGLAVVALASLPFVARLLARRLPDAGLSRWWSLVYVLPVAIAAIVQAGFWWLFFAKGASNPMFGVVREILRPTLDAATPWVTAGLLTAWAVLLVRATRPAGG